MCARQLGPGMILPPRGAAHRVKGRLSRDDSGAARREPLPPASPPPCIAPMEARMLDTLTVPGGEDDFNTVVLFGVEY